WLGLPDALERCPRWGWPAGFRGRRDAFVLTAAAHGLTRRMLTRIRPADLRIQPPAVGGRDLVVDDDPRRCPACALTRWLRVIGVAHRWGRLAVKEHLVLSSDQRGAEHDCHGDLADDWQQVWQLVPAIDQWGWLTDWRPLSTRS